MTPTLLLLDATPLREIAEGRGGARMARQIFHDAWLRDRCVFSSLSLLAREDPRTTDTPSIEHAERLRGTLLGMGLTEVHVSWDTLRESAQFRELAPFSHAWLLAGIASHLDATLITDCPHLLRSLTRGLRTLPWTDNLTTLGTHADHNGTA